MMGSDTCGTIGLLHQNLKFLCSCLSICNFCWSTELRVKTKAKLSFKIC